MDRARARVHAQAEVDLDRAASLSVGGLAASLATDLERGLSADEAERRLARYGPNDPAPAPGLQWPSVLTRQFASKLILLLVVAAAISALLGEWLNSVAIGITVPITGGFGSLNEYRSERAIAALRRLTELHTEVIRDGLHEEVTVTDLVPGDLVAVAEGRTVAADSRVVEARGLLVNESILTGEPEAIAKTDTIDGMTENATLPTVLYAGTTVVAGSGLAVVVATGRSTSLGSIAAAVQTARRRATPLEQRLESLGNRLVAIFLGLCVILVGIGVAQGREPRLVIELSVSLAIGAVPEGLPAVATTTLAVAVRRLAGRNVLVRRLDAVETLGSTTVIATDKTGTLTENRMVVRGVILPGGEEYALSTTCEGAAIFTSVRLWSGGPAAPEALAAVSRIVTAAALASDAVIEYDHDRGWHAHGDPSEGAIALAAAGLDDRSRTLYPRIATEPFTSAARFMRTTHRTPGGGVLVAAKGAFESLGALTGESLPLLAEAVHARADAGYRLLAVAEGEAAVRLHLLGAVVLEDPLRPDAAEAVSACRDAGIRVILVTGDQINTARNIGSSTGILDDRGVAMVASELDLADLDRVAVVARATHVHKEAIVDALQDDGEVVAMTGDGVNDAPALRSADVGVAIGPGATDVALEAAHIVVADGRLLSLVQGIREGRQITHNLRQAIVYLLTASFGTILLITAAMAYSDDLPLAPLQILWLNIVVHIFPALALAMGGDGEDNSTGPSGILISTRTWSEIGWRAATVAGGGLAALLVSQARGEAAEHGQAMVFATIAFGLVGQSFLIGVHTPGAHLARLRRTGLWLAVAISTLFLLAAMWLPGLKAALDLATITGQDWAVVAVAVAGAWALGQAGSLILARVADGARRSGARVQENRA